MQLAVVIVTHRADGLLDACLASLRAQTRAPDEVLVVVSNEARAVDAPALQLGANVGYARAANAGAAATRGEVLLLNDDTRLHPGCLAALEAAWSGPGVYQPRIVLADGSGRMDNTGLGYLPDGAVWALGRDGPVAGARARPPGSFSGAAVLIARACWDATGGFDERMGSFGEDVDLSLRLLRRGVVPVAVPDAVVEHHLGASWGRTSAEKVRLIERNRVRAAARSLPLSALVALPLTTTLRYAVLAGLGARGRGPGAALPGDARGAALRGLAEGVADLGTWLRDRRADAPSWRLGERQMLAALWRGRARWEDLAR